jgi:hypothetical protein
MNLVHNNYLRPSGSGNTFSVDIDPTTSTETTNYFEASKQAAEMVADSRQGELHLMYSGGVDSEYTLALFNHLDIPITPVIIKLLPDYNAHDVAYAFKYCEQQGIEPLVFDLNFDDFVNSGQMYRIALAMNCSKFQYAATAYAISQLNGTVLCGDGEPYIRLDPETNRWNIMIHEYEYGLANHFKLNNICGTPHFNRYTKEMYYEFLKDSRMWDLANNRVPGKTSSFSSKWIVYNRHSGFNLEERPKYHGYENIEQRDIFSNESFDLIEKIVGQEYNGDWVVDYFNFLKECVQ